MAHPENLFTELVDNGWRALERLFSVRQAESLYLDFKVSRFVENSNNITNDDLKNLAKAISGFGNSEGGVIIWGVGTQGKDGDLAQQLQPIPSVKTFGTLVDGAVAGRTIPPHENILTKVIWENAEGYGVAATYISKGMHRPYQSIPEYKYYLRAGNSFQPVPHDILRALFIKDPRTYVEPGIQYRIYVILFDDGSVGIGFRLVIENTGEGIAEDLYCSMNISSGHEELGTVRFTTDGVSAADRWIFEKEFHTHFHAVSDKAYRLPPRSYVTAMGFELTFDKEINEDLILEIHGGAANAPRSHFEVCADVESINDMIATLRANKNIEPAPHKQPIEQCGPENGMNVDLYNIFTVRQNN